MAALVVAHPSPASQASAVAVTPPLPLVCLLSPSLLDAHFLGHPHIEMAVGRQRPRWGLPQPVTGPRFSFPFSIARSKRCREPCLDAVIRIGKLRVGRRYRYRGLIFALEVVYELLEAAWLCRIGFLPD